MSHKAATESNGFAKAWVLSESHAMHSQNIFSFEQTRGAGCFVHSGLHVLLAPQPGARVELAAGHRVWAVTQES